MLHHSQVKLGKKPAKRDPRTLKLARYFTMGLPTAPDAADNTSGITAWGMMLNDSLGDCTIAACGHAIQVWTGCAGSEVTLPDSAILEGYESWCGYDPGDSNTDRGGVEVDVLNNWRKSSFSGHVLSMYADPEPTNLEHIKQAIYLFGGVYIGVALPVSVQNHSIWDVHPGENNGDNTAGSWGGHAVYVPKYRTENGRTIFTCITWGASLDITQDFWTFQDADGNSYIDEVHALVSPDFLKASGETPEGLDLAAMEADVEAVAD